MFFSDTEIQNAAMPLANSAGWKQTKERKRKKKKRRKEKRKSFALPFTIMPSTHLFSELSKLRLIL